MVIYFVGAHGTGKSTLLNKCRTIFPNYFFSEGLSRPIIRSLKDVKIDSNKHQEIVNELTISAYLNQIENRNVMCTRSVIDSIVYSQVLYPDVRIDSYLEVWKQTQHKVDVLFYTPIEFDLEEDNERKGVWTDKQIQKDIDTQFVKFLTTEVNKSKIVELKGNVEQRIQKIKVEIEHNRFFR